MALFFDQDWFDARLRANGLTRASLAQAAGMSIDEVELVFRDQRELQGPEVRAIAHVLSVDPDEVAERSGAAQVHGGAAPQDASRRPGAGFPGSGFPGASVNGSGGFNGPAPFTLTREVIAGLHDRMDRLEQLIEVVIHRLDRMK